MAEIPIIDLPEEIFVDTHIVDISFVVKNDLRKFFIVSAEGLKAINLNDLYQNNDNEATNIDVPKDSAVVPTRDRNTQTKAVVNKDAATQYNLEIQQEKCDFAQRCAIEEEQLKNQYEVEQLLFLDYVQHNSTEYPNGKQECLICGEITATIRGLHRHLAIHWGPTALCSVCGVQVEHKIRLAEHICMDKQRRRHHPRYKCPHYKCKVCAISPQELYDHINEHLKQLRYSCENCKRSFTTIGELFRHCEVRPKCNDKSNFRKLRYSRTVVQSKIESRFYRRTVAVSIGGKKQMLILKKSLLRLRSNASRLCCRVCMKNCCDKWVLKRHEKRCIHKHGRRIRKAKLKYKQSL